MWIKKKEWFELKERVAALEKEQLRLKEHMVADAENDRELIKTVKGYRDEITKLVEAVNADIAEQFSE